MQQQQDAAEETKSLGNNGNMSAKPESATETDCEFKNLASILGLRGRPVTRKYVVNMAIEEIRLQMYRMKELQTLYKQCREEREAKRAKLLLLTQGRTGKRSSHDRSKIFLDSGTTFSDVSKRQQGSEVVVITDSPKNYDVSASDSSSPCKYVRDEVPSSAPLVAASASQPIELICLDDDSDDDRISSASSRSDSVVSGKCEAKVNPNCDVGTGDVSPSTSDCSKEKLAVSGIIPTGCSRDKRVVTRSISANCSRDKPAVAGSLATCKLKDSVRTKFSQPVIIATTIKLKPRLVAPSRSSPSSLEYLCQSQLQKDPSYVIINTLRNKIIKIGHGHAAWRNPKFISTSTQISATFSSCISTTQARIVGNTVKVVPAHLSTSSSFASQTAGGSIATATKPGIDNFKLRPITSNLVIPQKENNMLRNCSQYVMGATPSVSHALERNIISVAKPEVAYVKLQPGTSDRVPHKKIAPVLQKASLSNRLTLNLPQNPTNTVTVNLPKVDFMDTQPSTLSLTMLHDKRFNNKSKKLDDPFPHSNVASGMPKTAGKNTLKINGPEVDFRKSKPSASCITMSHNKDTYMSQNKLSVFPPRIAAPNVPHTPEKIVVISASNAVHKKSQKSELCSDSKKKLNYLLCNKASPSVTETSGKNVIRVSTHDIDSVKKHLATASINNISEKVVDALPHSGTSVVPEIPGKIVIVNMSESDVIEAQPAVSHFTVPDKDIPSAVSNAVHNQPPHKTATILPQTSCGRVNSQPPNNTTIDVLPAKWEQMVKVDEPISINLQPKFTYFSASDSLQGNVTATLSSSQTIKNVMQIAGQKIKVLKKPIVVRILPKTSALPIQMPRNRVGFLTPQNSGGKVVTVREPLVPMQASTSGLSHPLSFEKLSQPNELGQSPTHKQ